MCFWKALRRWQVYTLPKRSVSLLIAQAQIELLAFIPPGIPYFRTFTMPWTKFVSIIDVLFRVLMYAWIIGLVSFPTLS
jgi:hypothetical protein